MVDVARRADPAADALFTGPGEMVERCRALDWSASPLGPVAGWSQSLRTMAAAVLASRNPMLLFWGPDLVQIYNDAFRPSLGPASGPAPRHPRALGMPARDFWTDVWDVIGPQIEGVMERGEAVWFEDLHLPIERGNGVLEDAWWTYSYSPVRDDDGSINGTLVVCLETTSSVRARADVEFERQRMAQLFLHAPAFMCVLRGPDHVFELANVQYQKLVGFRDILGKPAREALPEVEAQGYIALLDQVLDTGEPYIGSAQPVELQPTKGGPVQVRFLSFVYQAITEADGSRSGVFVHGVDVTELIEARAAAEAANRSKVDFLATMSHELRTPLNAIDGYAQLLEMGVHGPVTPTQMGVIGRIRSSQQHLLTLINDILNYARIEAGAVTYHLADICVDDVLASCESLTAPQRRARGLELQAHCAEDLWVRVDRDRLEQIMLNLMTNAIKFTEPGGRITITCVADRQDVRIAVADTGRGIPEDSLESIFEPFVQMKTSHGGSREGVGLGLAISRDLARGMGGDLTAESTFGAGSVFTIRLPRVQVP
jgi:signal transduction histidine kinase